jgi:hypothetical protein
VRAEGGVRELLLLLLYDHTRNTMPEARALPLARLVPRPNVVRRSFTSTRALSAARSSQGVVLSVSFYIQITPR